MDNYKILLLLLIAFLAYCTLRSKEKFEVFGGTYRYATKQSFPYSDLYNCYACPKTIPKPYEMNDLIAYDKYVIYKGRYIPIDSVYDTYTIHNDEYMLIDYKS